MEGKATWRMRRREREGSGGKTKGFLKISGECLKRTTTRSTLLTAVSHFTHFAHCTGKCTITFDQRFFMQKKLLVFT